MSLPKNIQEFIALKRASHAWRNNQYRTNGNLHKDAFQRAYERPDSITTLEDLKETLNNQTPLLWENHPWKHYDVTSHVFTLNEFRSYVTSRKAKPLVYLDEES